MARTRKRTQGEGKSASSAVADVYQNMLQDAVRSSPSLLGEEGPAIKRRRVGSQVRDYRTSASIKTESEQRRNLDLDTEAHMSDRQQPTATLQTAYAESEDSAESDLDWEEIDIQKGLAQQMDEDMWKEAIAGGSAESGDETGDINLVLNDNGKSEKPNSIQRRKPITAEERKVRLAIHKMHLLSLMVHIHRRNHWCNDPEVQLNVKGLLPKSVLAYFVDDDRKPQFQRSDALLKGLERAVEIFKGHFKITARGISRPYWADDAEHLADYQIPDDIDLPMQKIDFLEDAKRLKGSRDVGAQLFCAMLRSLDVESRLVCSLQPMAFTAVAKGTTPLKSRPAMVVSYPDLRMGISGDESGGDTGSDTSIRTTASAIAEGAKVGRIRSNLASRLGRPLQSAERTTTPTKPPPPKKPPRLPIRESSYPIYWVEVFNPAIQKWVAIDPLVTKTIAKPSKLEPPASDPENNMSYVLAFEDDGSARDVTRRYCKAYNAKTRKVRVEITKDGDKWWKKVLRMYKRLNRLDRDQLEEAELVAKEAKEPMPRNLQDFKDHPYYALERHLKRSEVIHPKREVGRVSAGKSGTLEPIYRRRDVHMVKSADSWYRLGREIKTGEQPLKRVQGRTRRELSTESHESAENIGTPMYAAFQTIAYVAPPVVNGMVPKNEYRNLDIYVPSMIPPGGVHISQPDTAKAARLLGIDYSDAVTGFEFRGRHGTAVIRGAVVAKEYREAVEAVVDSFDDAKAEAEELKRSNEALRMWRRLLAGLRIRERIEGYQVEGEGDAVREELDKLDVDEELGDGGGGGFFPDTGQDVVAEPTAGLCFEQPQLEEDEVDQDDEGGGGFLPGDLESDNEEVGTGDFAKTRLQIRDSHEAEDYGGGGFLPEDDDFVGMSHQVKAPSPKIKSTDEEEDDYSGDGGGLAAEDSANQQGNLPLTSLDEKGSQISQNMEPDSPAQTHGLEAEDLAEATLLQQIYEAERLNASRPQPDKAPATAHSSIPASAPIVSTIDNSPVSDGNEHKEEEPGVVEDESEEDKGSLLSQDPDDEDADPDWLD